jgi:hypothetical protein
MEEWFYVKNDLKAREDIKEIIQRPIRSCFGLRRPKVEIDGTVEACQRAFSTICAFIGTRDLIQEHISFRVWPLVESWDMPKETTADSSDGGLVQLKYIFRFREKFDEPDDDWLKCIKATSDELLGAYSKAEDNALSTAFGGRGKKRLNRVFDAIGFVYPDYHYPLRGQEKKRKIVASATSAESKGKKMKVLIHRPRYTEPVVVPKFGVGTSSVAEPKRVAPIVQSAEEPTIVSKVPTFGPAEVKDDKVVEPQVEKVIKVPENVSPPSKANLPKVQRIPAATPKKRRMASVLNAVIETTKALSPAPKKIVEATKVQAKVKVGPSVSIETKPTAPEEKTIGQIVPEKTETPALEAPNEDVDYIIRYASGKKLSQEEILEARHFAQRLKYPKGALAFNGSNEEDFLYCLPDNKEIFVYREIAKSMGFPKLEEGLSVLSKDDLADSLAYNSIKV